MITICDVDKELCGSVDEAGTVVNNEPEGLVPGTMRSRIPDGLVKVESEELNKVDSTNKDGLVI